MQGALYGRLEPSQRYSRQLTELAWLLITWFFHQFYKLFLRNQLTQFVHCGQTVS